MQTPTESGSDRSKARERASSIISAPETLLYLGEFADDLCLVAMPALLNDCFPLNENFSHRSPLNREQQLLQKSVRLAPGYTWIVQIDRSEISRVSWC